MKKFSQRHIGPSQNDEVEMLKALGLKSLDQLCDEVVPRSIRSDRKLDLPPALDEVEALEDLRKTALKNIPTKSFIGMGYYGTVVPAVIQRNILENPGWYTQYTPYQSEIAQGRLEALLNFQTMVADLTGMEISNASLLDEATAAAEAMTLCLSVNTKSPSKRFLVSSLIHPQTLAVLQTRAAPLGIELVIESPEKVQWKAGKYFGAFIQNPDTLGKVQDLTAWISKAHQSSTLVVVACDLLALCLFKSPGAMGADVVVGSSQRFGVPMGFGGPHAAFLATKNEYQRRIPGRIVGVSRDAEGRVAYRLALQTREQHIRRDKATSNICTAQVLLAIMASMYAVYHGPTGLRDIADRVHRLARTFARRLKQKNWQILEENFFDTIVIQCPEKKAQEVLSKASERDVALRTHFAPELAVPNGMAWLGVSMDETIRVSDLENLLLCFGLEFDAALQRDFEEVIAQENSLVESQPDLARSGALLEHPVFNRYHSETELLRYMHRLESKDLSLNYSMIPLGSCTMKLNATSEMVPVTWPQFGEPHPFLEESRTVGYREMIHDLEKMLSQVTGFDAISMQPNAGSQGEYAGLLVIRRYLDSIGQRERNICLIPSSAHGTNPASAVMAGFKVVVVQCDREGNIDLTDLKTKAEKHRAELAALMITYPSTHGVFEESVREICQLIHTNGGQVYMDGANLNAQIGLCYPPDFGADVCHLNLHKTFCIPHGGGGPGMGPIGVKKHLIPFLPNHPVVKMGGEQGQTVSAGPWGSAGILPISWMYIRMMGEAGLKRATQVAILNANYVAKRLEPHYPILYKGARGWVAHECIIDLRAIQSATDVTVEDVAKRLMDYGFHAPTVSWPVVGTMMIEPTESESKMELDRFCDAMIEIRKEIRAIENGQMDRKVNPLKLAPHTSAAIASEGWDRPYQREQAVFPTAWVKNNKFWPSVARIDNVYGDRNVVCACPPLEAYE